MVGPTYQKSQKKKISKIGAGIQNHLSKNLKTNPFEHLNFFSSVKLGIWTLKAFAGTGHRFSCKRVFAHHPKSEENEVNPPLPPQPSFRFTRSSETESGWVVITAKSEKVLGGISESWVMDEEEVTRLREVVVVVVTELGVGGVAPWAW